MPRPNNTAAAAGGNTLDLDAVPAWPAAAAEEPLHPGAGAPPTVVARRPLPVVVGPPEAEAAGPTPPLDAASARPRRAAGEAAAAASCSSSSPRAVMGAMTHFDILQTTP